MRLLQLFTACVLLLAFVWGAVGASGMEGLQAWHRQQVMARVAGKSQQRLVLTREEYQSLTKGHQREIQYQGKAYDIVASEEQGELVVLDGYFDHFDERLFHLIDRLIDEEGDEQDEGQRMPVFSYVGILPSGVVLHTATVFSSNVKIVLPATPALASIAMDVLKAPPDAVIG